MKRINEAVLMVIGGLSVSAWAQAETELEEMIVSAPFERKAAETGLPVTVLDGKNLQRQVANQLGESLSRQPGLHAASFGTGVGQPVIRGLSANRVRVLQDGLGVQDAAAVSPDHANAVEPLLATRIEVVRGPATLLYGNGAVGGVVNVIDGRIPESLTDGTRLALELRHNTVDDGDAGVVSVDGSAGKMAWHVDGVYRENGDSDVRGFPDKTAAVSRDRLRNSGGEGRGATVGVSHVGERGYTGIAVNRSEKRYGLPASAQGEDGALIELDMQQTRVDVKGEWQFDSALSSLALRLGHSDYQHRELEREDGAVAVGTVFNNRATEMRLLAGHSAIAGLEGVLGLQLQNRSFSAKGEESFIPATDSHSSALFFVESLEQGDWLWEFGLRSEWLQLDPGPACEERDQTVSGSVSALWRFSDNSNVLIGLSHSQRSPTLEERFSNIDAADCRGNPSGSRVVHAATGRVELGDPDLKVEGSNNIELAWRKHTGRIGGEFSLFYNAIDDYIFLEDTLETQNSVTVSQYRQRDAAFWGYEARLEFGLTDSPGQELKLVLLSDAVRARLKNPGADVPRIPPRRYGLGLEYDRGAVAFDVLIHHSEAQKRHADSESLSDGFTRIDMGGSYQFDNAAGETEFFFSVANALNQEIRLHSSVLKDRVPEPARNVTLGMRWRY